MATCDESSDMIERVDFDPVDLLMQLEANLRGITAFWRERGVDSAGGYHTLFDRDGVVQPEQVKTLIAQTRILWTYSTLGALMNDDRLIAAARHGFDYLVRRFHDDVHSGWFWSVDADGPHDPAKLMYGQGFALYALSAYATATGDHSARDLAVETFNAIHQVADLAHGGFWENVDSEWNPENTGAGCRKSLDIHLHLLEAFTTFAGLTKDPVHIRRLREIRDLLLDKMVDPIYGIGGNQYAADFTPLQPIIIGRTWIAERTDDVIAPGHFTTSYSHNLELGWLLGRADELIDGDRHIHAGLVDRMATHTLRYGFDHDFGGVYREGPPLGPATDTDKEFWQNAEALTGFLHAYDLTGRAQYAEAFARTWSFAKTYLIHPTLYEWRIRASRDGALIDDSLGNQWTGGYHTVRAAVECVHRLSDIVGTMGATA